MKQDYNKVMKQQISSFGCKPKLLLHCCCAPCSSAVIERLAEFFEITFYYYNPNIYPELEYDARAEEFIKLGIKIEKSNYNHTDFLENIKGLELETEGGLRCQSCIKLRMENSFKYAKEQDYDIVATTLTISPHKDADFINKIGEELAMKHSISFLHSDFKKESGYLRSIEISKKLKLYRQTYCGCEFV